MKFMTSCDILYILNSVASNIIIIIIIISSSSSIYSLEFFTSALADGFSLDSEW